MNRYAAKFMRLPAILDHSYWLPQMTPKGAAMLVTKEIMAKMKHIVMTATRFTLLLVLDILCLFISLYELLFIGIKFSNIVIFSESW